jgi:hypothetical protein
MRGSRSFLACLMCAAVVLTSGCAAPAKPDYSLYRTHMPKSVLVLPPLNNSVEVKATYGYLSTISRPLAECGYYVFPVAVVDAFMKENGLPTAGEMHAVSLEKFREVFGADAVLYVTIEDYGQKYYVLSSVTIVKAYAALVDAVTGETLWAGKAEAVQGSGDSGGGILGALITAAVTQMLAWSTDNAHILAIQANGRMVFDTNRGLLFGPYSPEHSTDPRGR